MRQQSVKTDAVRRRFVGGDGAVAEADPVARAAWPLGESMYGFGVERSAIGAHRGIHGEARSGLLDDDAWETRKGQGGYQRGTGRERGQ